MKTSLLGIKAIGKREGTVLHVYLDSKGLPTVGCGHLLVGQEKIDYPLGTKITQAQSDAWLSADLKECEDAVNALHVDLKQNEFDALVSLAFNIGVAGFSRSTVARKLKANDHDGAAEAILLWDKPKEIIRRRRTEYNQFKTPYKDSAAIASNNPPVVSNKGESGVTSDANSTSPPSTTVEATQSQTKQEGETLKTEQTTVTTEQPKGDLPSVPPTQVSKRGPLAIWLFSGGGLMTVFTGIWGFITTNGNVVAVAILVLGMLIFAIIFRHAITDAIRMTSAADVDKKNVS